MPRGNRGRSTRSRQSRRGQDSESMAERGRKGGLQNTLAQQEARRENIKRAQEARRKESGGIFNF